MLPEWLTEDAFIWKELIKSLFSVIISLLLILLGRKILFRRDRKIRELDRSRDLFDELRKEFVEIDNEYYKVRKRFATVRHAFKGQTRRNPYIVKFPAKRDEVMDALLVTCIGLEGRYYTLMQRLKVSFPDFWNSKLKSLMERENKSNRHSLEYYFDEIRDCIEKDKDIDQALKKPLAEKFEQIIEEFDSYESKLLVYPQRKPAFHLLSTRLSKRRFFRTVVMGLFVCLGMTWAQAQSDQVLYSLRKTTLFDGKFGKLAEVQAAIGAALVRCGKPSIAADGKFGNGTALAVKALVACSEIQPHIPPDSAARQGAITQSLWKALLPNSSLPSVEERSQTLVLTYEATDYDRLEWNFCQNKPLWSPQNPSMPCFTNDPKSYITWGPRGATAGHGREVQWILWRVDQRDPSIVNTAFGSDASTLRRLISLNDSSARILLCSIYADEQRRNSWTRAFEKFGKSALVRSMYDLHYLSRASDGAKMATFYKLYDKLGIRPTEVDYAFFLDRATHSSAPSDLDTAARKIQAWLDEKQVSRTPSNVRRAIAAKFPTTSQTKDRLGRDVAFFIDAVSEPKLTPEERQAWINRGQLSAANVGLSDEREAPALNAGQSTTGPSFNASLEPTPPCPPSVLNPRTPPSH